MIAVIVGLSLAIATGIPASFGVGFYVGRRSKYEDVNKLEPTPIVGLPTVTHTEAETEHGRSEMVPLIQD